MIYVQFISNQLIQKNCSDYFYNNCHGIGYHLTSKNNVEKILNTGLRTRSGIGSNSDGYRNFPRRIYFCASEKFNDFEMLKSVAKEITDDSNRKTLSILKLNLSHSSIDVYRDLAMNNSNCFFTYHNIPPEWIVQELHWPYNWE